MPYTVSFLDQKLYQSLSFDADMKFSEASEYARKVWDLKEYKKAGGELDLTEGDDKKTFSGTYSSYELQKSFKGDELVVELVQNVKFSDDFNYFSEAEVGEETGEEELDQILSRIKDTKFNSTQNQKLFGVGNAHKFGDFKWSSDEESCCGPDDQCGCE